MAGPYSRMITTKTIFLSTGRWLSSYYCFIHYSSSTTNSELAIYLSGSLNAEETTYQKFPTLQWCRKSPKDKARILRRPSPWCTQLPLEPTRRLGYVQRSDNQLGETTTQWDNQRAKPGPRIELNSTKLNSNSLRWVYQTILHEMI